MDNFKYVLRPSALELYFSEDDILQILEKHVRELINDSNAQSLSAHKVDDGYTVAIFSKGGTVQDVGQMKEETSVEPS